METNPEEYDPPTRLESLAQSMKPWLLILGVAFMLIALPYAWTGQGLLVAWVPVWLGLMLVQAAMAAGRMDVERMVHKLKEFVVLLGLTFVIMLIVSVLAVALAVHPSIARWIEWVGF